MYDLQTGISIDNKVVIFKLCAESMMGQFYRCILIWATLIVASTVTCQTQIVFSSAKGLVDSVRNNLVRSIGTRAPDLPFQSLGSNSMQNVSSFRGSTLLLKFWNRGCAPCIREMPDVGKLHDRYQDAKFNVIFLSHDDIETQVRFFSINRTSGLKGYLNSDELARPYQAFVAPMSVLIDSSGVIRDCWLGAIGYDSTEQRLNALIPKRAETSKMTLLGVGFLLSLIGAAFLYYLKNRVPTLPN